MKRQENVMRDYVQNVCCDRRNEIKNGWTFKLNKKKTNTTIRGLYMTRIRTHRINDSFLILQALRGICNKLRLMRKKRILSTMSYGVLYFCSLETKQE